MNTNAYFIVKDFKSNNRTEGYCLSIFLSMQVLEISSNWVEWSTELWKSEEFQRKAKKRKSNFSLDNSMEYTKLKSKSKEHANSAFAMTAANKISSFLHANARDLAKVSIFNASRCGSTAKSRNK